MNCKVCGERATVIGTEFVFDEYDERKSIEHLFCEEHYKDWCNNEIELPAERLAVLDTKGE